MALTRGETRSSDGRGGAGTAQERGWTLILLVTDPQNAFHVLWEEGSYADLCIMKALDYLYLFYFQVLSLRERFIMKDVIYKNSYLHNIE